ncbi:MAG: transketolase, partial [FCB group bacterium]|nr:transketolase [FCB group bacterium]
TGSEVHICIDAANHMRDDGVNVSVVSMPCTELFDRQSAEYRESVLPGDVKIRLAVEAGSSFGWSRYTLGSEENTVIGINHFGASAPANKLFERYGFTSRNIMEKALILLKKA